MKKIIMMFIAALFLIPSVGMSFESVKKHTEIEKDKAGGYSETQKDYKKKMHKRDQKKKRAGYYNHKYHNQSPEFKQGDNQFIKSGSEVNSKKKGESHDDAK